MQSTFGVSPPKGPIRRIDLRRMVEAMRGYLANEAHAWVLGSPLPTDSLRSLVDAVFPVATGANRWDQNPGAHRMRQQFRKAGWVSNPPTVDDVPAGEVVDETAPKYQLSLEEMTDPKNWIRQDLIEYIRLEALGGNHQEEQDRLHALYDIQRTLEPFGIPMDIDADRLGLFTQVATKRAK